MPRRPGAEWIVSRYLAEGEILVPEHWSRRSPAIKVAENLARLLGPLL